ncbi:FecR domain-containing protein [Planctomicrobium sp. SH661]|uniref:FecR domain-containing protein n=1 Tax=Planctomicrobium sp. SH661 TaxID=3448124 RepID=UPI003F5AF7B2
MTQPRPDLSDWMDGDRTNESARELDAWLASDPANATEFVREMLLHSELERGHWRKSGASPAAGLRRHRSVLRNLLATCACIGVLGTLIWLFAARGTDPANPPTVLARQTHSSGQAVPASTVVGRLSRSINAQWKESTVRWSVGDSLRSGELLQLEAGRLELEFTSGGRVTLVGPAVLQIDSPFSVTLLSGVATTRVEKLNSGLFRVLTPHAEIVDLGTEFGVRVDPESEVAEVIVFEGAVDLLPVNIPQSETSLFGILNVGEAVRIFKSGGMERLVSVDTSAFPSGDRIFSIPPRRAPVITAVSDDRRSQNSPKYYQIFHSGLSEDSKAYVDRDHEWNGQTEEGIPYFLRGADYIATFNDDKGNSPEITVELSRPATLYIFLDVRLEVPAWISEQFEDTGYRIGLDEGPLHGPGSATAIGPGVSIDNAHTVWKRVIPQPGPVRLGSLDIPGPRRATMYGIAAQPLNEHP